ncbi:hypothetical protein SNE25_21250 [Mucilaginibacter sabulilitoris]|uniref:Uncharacterized protein n=1 Tax=Mucilaginibacter sabulilitoris TaxID=1173583 RepID=A0ABZ0TI07_9SPHI|nr:hypothetical protein [Mucilaginibacter sabulilitoris]WPU91848.1 hypothetical protein SNE25_21250 [Mucilaginibacter sabulilitoris]
MRALIFIAEHALAITVGAVFMAAAVITYVALIPIQLFFFLLEDK